MKNELVIVLDFGGQYNQLVARRVRECNVYCEIYSYKTDIEKIKAMNPKGIILTGTEQLLSAGFTDIYGRAVQTGDSSAGTLLRRAADDACARRRGQKGRCKRVWKDRGPD